MTAMFVCAGHVRSSSWACSSFHTHTHIHATAYIHHTQSVLVGASCLVNIFVLYGTTVSGYSVLPILPHTNASPKVYPYKDYFNYVHARTHTHTYTHRHTQPHSHLYRSLHVFSLFRCILRFICSNTFSYNFRCLCFIQFHRLVSSKVFIEGKPKFITYTHDVHKDLALISFEDQSVYRLISIFIWFPTSSVSDSHKNQLSN